MNLGLGLRLGQSGGRAKYTDIAIPALANAVRCWSIRRNIPAYKNGNAVRIIRTDGGSETDVKFSPNGLLSISGADAFVNALYEQNGNVGSALVQSTFANCPSIYVSNELLKGTQHDASDVLTMANPDAGIDEITNPTAVTNNGFTLSLWGRRSGGLIDGLMYRRSVTSGLLDILTNGSTLTYRYKSSDNQTISGFFVNNTWTMVTLVAKGADGTANGVKIYKNGNIAGQIQTPVTNTLATTNLTLQSSSTGATHRVNDVLMYNKNLSDAEVLALYNAQAPYYGLGAK